MAHCASCLLMKQSAQRAIALNRYLLAEAELVFVWSSMAWYWLMRNCSIAATW